MSAFFEHRYAYTNGIRMHYVEHGEGPLVLLCHGWPESWYSWRHQIEAIAAAGFRVIAPGQRGYADTEAPLDTTSYDILNLTGDLVGLVNALGEKQAILMGHDWGSIVAATAALLRPDLFRALTLLSVPYLPRSRMRPAVHFQTNTLDKHFYQDYFQMPGRVERELEEDIRRSLLGIYYTAAGDSRRHPEHRRRGFIGFEKSARFVDSLAYPDTLPGWLSDADLDVFAAQFTKSGFRGTIDWYRNLDRNWALTPFLDGARIMQPTLFVAGELDGVIHMTAKAYEALESNVPRLTKKVLIPEAGHWIQQERPEEVNALLLEFLRDPAVLRELA
jgi:pimeloyl-ACP methyl ester carboxylesterase